MSVVDTVVAYKFIKILSTPWKKTDAYKLGIIDDKGTVLKKRKDLKTSEEKKAYTIFHTLCWNIKRLLDKLPPTRTRLGSFATALWMLKEYLDLSRLDSQKLFETSEDYFKAKGLDIRMNLLEGAKKKRKLNKGKYVLKADVTEDVFIGDTVILENDSFPIAEIMNVPLYQMIHEKTKRKVVVSGYEIKEQPANNIGGGNIAGAGYGGPDDKVAVDMSGITGSINRRERNRQSMQSLTGINYPRGS